MTDTKTDFQHRVMNYAWRHSVRKATKTECSRGLQSIRSYLRSQSISGQSA